MELPALTPYVMVIGAFLFGYGALNQRLKSLEESIKTTVTRVEFHTMGNRLDEVVSELRGLRGDILKLFMDRGNG